MFKKTHQRYQNHRSSIGGFTLVEMLVSVAIVLLMMTMFTQIFVMATGTLSKQRGIAENDQRGRMLATTLRGDLDRRTFRDVFPFRSKEDTRQLGNSLARRAGYLEIDEGIPSDDTDDVLTITCSANIKLQNTDTTPFAGRAQTLSGVLIQNLTTDTITLAGDYTSLITTSLPLWVVGSISSNGATNNGRYVPLLVSLNGPNTNINFPANSFTIAGGSPWGYLCLSESEPEFDDGIFGNDSSTSAVAEVCYFLRNGVLYRRVLLIRDTQSAGDAQPTWSNGLPILWNNATKTENYPTGGPSTFWRDFDYSAFYFNGKTVPSGGGARYSPGVRFHKAAESLSNSSQAPSVLVDDSVSPPVAFPVSLGIPHYRFGHNFTVGSATFGLPIDASTVTTLPGPDGIYGNADDVPVSIGRFTLQECSNSAFGYPGNIPAAGNPFNRTDLEVDPNTGLVRQFSGASGSALYPGQTFRRGEDILMSNVLSFDVKVWDPNTLLFVDIGDDSAPVGTNATAPTFGTSAPGRLNTTYGANNHFRFDTWHPLASVGPNANDAEPPYVILYYDNNLPTFPPIPVPLTSIQITINYRDVSSNQIRQVTVVQSLVDRTKPPSVTAESPEE